MDLTVLVFLLVYVSMGLGHLPGFKVDRTGAAILGAMVLIAFDRISPQAAWSSIDVNTMGLLFGLMVVSSGFVLSGFYNWTAHKVGQMRVGPSMLMAILILVSGVLSAFLTNDVVVVAMTPVLCAITLARGLNPVPFLLGFCFAANVGSTATLIGSPQNMIVAQSLGMSFGGFSGVAAVPSLLGLALVWLSLCVMYRGRWQLAPGAGLGKAPAPGPELDAVETAKAGLVTVAVVAAFILTDWPRMLIALAGASVMLLNRRISSGDLLKQVDGNLLLLLMGLFVVNATLAATGLPREILDALRGFGLDLHSPVSMLGVMALLSNVVGNSPAVMLIVPFLDGVEQSQKLGAAIALGTGFSSNAVVFGSLAGIIVVEQARAQGVAISFGEFCRSGLVVTFLTMMLAFGWILYLS